MNSKYLKYSISILLIGCLTAEPKEVHLIINKEQYVWNLSKPIIFKSNDYNVRIYANENNNDIFRKISNSFNLDNINNASDIILENYDIVLIEIENKSDLELNFSLSKFKVIKNNEVISPIIAKNLLKDFELLNKKGIAKNIYNSINYIVLFAAVIILIAIVTFGKGTSVNTPIQISGTEETDKFWSSYYQKYNISYKDLINEENNISPNSLKSGILFVRKGQLSNLENTKLQYFE
jgi:hypothetical protein